MFANIPDFDQSINSLQPAAMARLMNEIIRIFDETTDKYDVCRIKTKNIGNCMIVAGLCNGANIVSDDLPPLRVEKISIKKRFD